MAWSAESGGSGCETLKGRATTLLGIFLKKSMNSEKMFLFLRGDLRFYDYLCIGFIIMATLLIFIFLFSLFFPFFTNRRRGQVRKLPQERKTSSPTAIDRTVSPLTLPFGSESLVPPCRGPLRPSDLWRHGGNPGTGHSGVTSGSSLSK